MIKRMLMLMLMLMVLGVLVSCDEGKQKVYDRNGLPLAEKDTATFVENPHPTQGYRVKVQIEDPPGPLKLMGFSSYYSADNCRYTVSRFAGATGHPEQRLQVPRKMIDHNTFEGVVYLDGMLNEDYYGQGVCEWKLVSITAQFRATGKKEETKFIISQSPKDFLPNKTVTMYYLKKDYPITIYEDGEISEGHPDFGGKKEERNPAIPDPDWFRITMSIEEI